MVQLSVTLSPLRAARKSDGARGNSSEGGRGGPIEAHPANQTNAPTASINCPRSLMGGNNRLHHCQREFARMPHKWAREGHAFHRADTSQKENEGFKPLRE